MMLFLVILMQATSQSSFAGTNCIERETRHTFQQKTVSKKEVVCINEKRVSSPECTPLLNTKCFLSGKLKPVAWKDLVRGTGSPGFRLCHLLGGSPQSFEYRESQESGGSWHLAERCLSADERQFADLNELILYGTR